MPPTVPPRLAVPVARRASAFQPALPPSGSRSGASAPGRVVRYAVRTGPVLVRRAASSRPGMCSRPAPASTNRRAGSGWSSFSRCSGPVRVLPCRRF